MTSPWVSGAVRFRPRILKARGFRQRMYGDVWLLIRWDVGSNGSPQVRITGYDTWREAISAIT